MTDGALLLDKPVGVTSNRALQQAKKLLGARKAGHAGTLDPLASGLLVLLFGEATKLAGALLEEDKEYEATLKLGERTATGDAEGEVVQTGPAQAQEADIAAALQRFTGEIEQVPPMYSAIKRAGVPLYEMARRGQTVERAPRKVRIAWIRNLGFEPPFLRLGVRCSKGTYVRTLAEDLAAALGTCAHLAALRRTGAGRFRIEEATSLEALSALPAAERDRRLLGLPALLTHVPRAELDRGQEARFRNGQSLEAFPGEGLRAVYAADGGVIGLGAADGSGSLRPVRLFAARASG